MRRCRPYRNRHGLDVTWPALAVIDGSKALSRRGEGCVRPAAGILSAPRARMRTRRWPDGHLSRHKVPRNSGQPPEDLLFTLLQGIEAGEGSLLIIEHTINPAGHTYAQALRRDNSSYLVEHRDGGAGRQYRTVVADMHAARQLLTGLAFQLPDSNDHTTWSQIHQ